MSNQKDQQRLMIGPLVLKINTPLKIYQSLLHSLQNQVSRIDRKNTMQINFGYGRFNRHLQAIHDSIEWLDKYEIQNLVSLNCSHNRLPTFQYITVFYLPRLEILDLYDCQIESIELLAQCFLPNLLTLVLYNNHITSLKTLRRCYIPFLNELIVDSNNVSDISPLSELLATRLQRLQLHNNKIADVRALFKFNFHNLIQARYQNSELCIQSKNKQIIEAKIRNKFINI